MKAQRNRLHLNFKASGHITQIVDLRIGITKQQLIDGLKSGDYRTTIHGTEITDINKNQWVAKIHMTGPSDDFSLEAMV